MKYSLLLLALILTACGGGSGGSSASCLSGTFQNQTQTDTFTANQCDVVFQSNTCTLEATYSATEQSSGLLELTIKNQTAGCGAGLIMVCAFSFPSNNILDINCPDIDVTDIFYRL